MLRVAGRHDAAGLELRGRLRLEVHELVEHHAVAPEALSQPHEVRHLPEVPGLHHEQDHELLDGPLLAQARDELHVGPGLLPQAAAELLEGGLGGRASSERYTDVIPWTLER